MNVELKLSSLMSSLGEHDTIRVTPKQLKDLGIQEGSRLTINTPSGIPLSLLVTPSYLVDAKNDSNSSYVSQDTLDAITGNIDNPLTVTLGCDPEFVFLNRNKNIVPSVKWLPSWGAIGSDGPLAELRPLPATHEEGVVDNLRRLIKVLPSLVDAKFGKGGLLTPEAHSCWENTAIGFHIHLGAPKELLTFAAPKSKEFIETLITAMDYFVGIPAMLLEDTSTRRLGNGMYGKAGDYRVSTKTIEYRTPGGFHLRHPEYAEGIMGLSLCVGEEMLNRYRDLSSNWKNLDKYSSYTDAKERYNLPKKSEIKVALEDPTKKLAAAVIPDILRQLQRLETFDKHKRSICNYFNLLIDNTQFSPSILKNW